MANNYYNLTLDEVLSELESNSNGLTEAEAQARLLKHGPNSLPEQPVPTRLHIFLSQFINPLIMVLVISALIILFMGDLVDALIIFFVLFFNAIIGTVQEGKAQNTLQALKNFVTTNATVLREEKDIIIPDTQVVIGDVIYLSEGDKVPADARIISANLFKVDESSFTGESLPVNKNSEIISGSNIAPQNQLNMVFKGSHVTRGNAQAVVVATGLETEIGKISQVISGLDTDIPLKKRIEYLSKMIIMVVVAACLLIVLSGVFFGHSISEMFTIAVSLAVAIVPEGLPIVMTLILASGVWRMTKKQVLVKKLQAVEALGQAKIVAVDKTGTLTKNELVVEKIYIDGDIFEVSGDGYNPVGEITLNNKPLNQGQSDKLTLIARIAGFSANAQAVYNEEKKIWRTTGDPTEAAMTVLASKAGFKNLDIEAPLILDLPFDYSIKYHPVLRSFAGKNFLAVTGAPESVLNKCVNFYQNGQVLKMTEADRELLNKQFIDLSVSGLRIIACAFNPDSDRNISLDVLPDLTFAGFLGMKDALRVGVKETVKQFAKAGMRVVMITGDHPATALAIARDAGIASEKSLAITGADLENLSDEDLIKRFAKTSVFARVTPSHKLRIIELFRRRGEVVAMTGDGINDAPSLAAADLGVAMGNIGTEVAKEAADIILLDDNFSNIVSAAEEGRSIYKTIEKVILYLFSTSAGELLIIATAVLLNWPLPLLAAQIIWLNFVTDGFLDLSLAMERKESGLLSQKNSKPSKYILGKLSFRRMVVMSLVMAVGSLALFMYYIEAQPEKALTISLTVMAAFQWFNAWNCKNDTHSIFSKDILKNRWLILATIFVIFLQVLAVYTPFLQNLLRTSGLNYQDWLIIILVASLIIWPEEVRKFLLRRELKNNQ